VSYSELNRLLHERVLAISEHGVAQELATTVRGRASVTHHFRHAVNPRRMDLSLREHQDLIDALASRDSAAAEAVMRRHLAAVRDTLHAHVGSPDPFTASASSTTQGGETP
jgi:DNA-binding GntR family transcriptional regulator